MKQTVLLLSMIFLLLFCNRASVLGAKHGLLLWYQVLIPSLLPFILITNALSETGSYFHLAKHFKNQSSNKIYKMIAIFLGLLCGFPIGAKIIYDFEKNQILTSTEGKSILALSSQTSPMFLIGYVYIHILQNKLPFPIFLFVIYAPIFLFFPFFQKEAPAFQSQKQRTNSILPITDTFLHSVQIMVTIGIYVMIFSIFYEITLPLCRLPLYRIVLSFFEITNGLSLLQNTELDNQLKIPLICALSSFGGFCSTFQVFSVYHATNSCKKKYLYNKLILCTSTFLITYIYLLIKQ